MEGGRTLLLLAVGPAGRASGCASVLDDVPEFKAADRRWEAEVDADSKNVLHDAIAQYRAEQAATSEQPDGRRGESRPVPGAPRSVSRSRRPGRPGRAPASSASVGVRSAPAGSCERTTRCGRGISMPLAWSAASSRLRNSPAAAHCSGGPHASRGS